MREIDVAGKEVGERDGQPDVLARGVESRDERRVRAIDGAADGDECLLLAVRPELDAERRLTQARPRLGARRVGDLQKAIGVNSMYMNSRTRPSRDRSSS